MITPSGFMIPEDQIAEFCERHKIRKLALFGSVLRDDFREDSDIDVLVEFEPDVHLGLAFFTIQFELEDLLGRKVDFIPFESVNKYIRRKVLNSAQVVYDQVLTLPPAPPRIQGGEQADPPLSACGVCEANREGANRRLDGVRGIRDELHLITQLEAILPPFVDADNESQPDDL